MSVNAAVSMRSTTVEYSLLRIDADVFLSMFGDKASSERHELKETADRKKNKFESGSTDRFQLKAPELGKVSGTHLTHRSESVMTTDQNHSNRTQRYRRWRRLVPRLSRDSTCTQQRDLPVSDARVNGEAHWCDYAA